MRPIGEVGSDTARAGTAGTFFFGGRGGLVVDFAAVALARGLARLDAASSRGSIEPFVRLAGVTDLEPESRTTAGSPLFASMRRSSVLTSESVENLRPTVGTRRGSAIDSSPVSSSPIGNHGGMFDARAVAVSPPIATVTVIVTQLPPGGCAPAGSRPENSSNVAPFSVAARAASVKPPRAPASAAASAAL